MARSIIIGAASGLAGLLLLTASAHAAGGGLERSVLDEINFARTEPQAYGRLLARDAYASPAASDPAALREALDFLARQAPEPPLQPNTVLASAALSHADFQARSGAIGHSGPGGETLGERLRSHGAFAMLMGENIAYGYGDARRVVQQLIVDSGVPGRGHRANIFTAAYREAGVGCGPHPTYRVMCVIDFSGSMMRR
jgi:hypothetical protein